MKYLPQIKADNAHADAAAKKKTRPRPKRRGKGTATPAKEATAQSKGAAEPSGHIPVSAAAPADTSGRTFFDARPDEPPPSLIPPEVQAEIDRLKMVNRALRGALRSLIEDE